MEFVLVHRIPGRARLRMKGAFGVRTATALADALDALDDMEGVRVNPRTGSVLLLYAEEGVFDRAREILGRARKLGERTVPAQACRNAEKPGLFPFFRYLFIRPLLPMAVNMVTASARALPFLRRCFSSLVHGRLDVDALDGAAIAVSLARRDFGTVGLLTLLLGFGDALERYTQKKSLENLASHLALQVDRIWVRRDGVETLVPFAGLRESDRVIVRAGSAVPVDGVVEEGTAQVNESSMTGEPLGVMRGVGASVYAGTVVEAGEIAVRPTSVGRDTRMQQIVRFIENAEQMKAGVQGRFETLADRAVPVTFALAGLVWLFTRSLTRAASVLLVDYSCALRLATPLAILSAMNEGVKRRVMVKGGRFLEALSTVDTVVFDKTGTLTQSRPEVARVVAAEGFDEDFVLRLSACLEEHFPHPVARAVVHGAERRNLRHEEEHTDVEYVVAHGIASQWRGRRVLLGSRHYVAQDEGVDVAPLDGAAAALSREGYSLLYLSVDGRVAGIIAVEDPVRPESAVLVERLRAMGVSRVVMLTGDDERTASAVAARLGITEYCAQVLPEDKARVVRALRDEGRVVLMIGDGINDSPALSTADVGVTLRDGSDLAREVADVVLMGGSLNQLVTALELGRGAMRRIHVNFAATMALNSAFLFGGLTGLLRPGASAVLHNLTTIGVSLNAMRPVLSREE
ncbi:heavy metal translocating P-type ATPase [uncultured Mailhella sp.]|uniref:heavy metal translocating P-type ATPase n=1 Tax=uncultured Mailhella sp. TaxID=1981031 RepID=UPI0025D0EDCC|nr:heavy metal translocating P-type ATPase [uncultured Mailhella sp.]